MVERRGRRVRRRRHRVFCACTQFCASPWRAPHQPFRHVLAPLPRPSANTSDICTARTYSEQETDKASKQRCAHWHARGTRSDTTFHVRRAARRSQDRDRGALVRRRRQGHDRGRQQGLRGRPLQDQFGRAQGDGGPSRRRPLAARGPAPAAGGPRGVLRPMSHYEVLGAAVSDDAATLRRLYLRESVRLHPDKSPAPGAAAAFARLAAAWEVLGDPDARRAYDRTLQVDEEVVVWRAAPVSEFRREGDALRLDCRCGGSYEVCDEELAEGVDLVPCDGCSCHVRIKNGT
mmetsp:Transcript_13041/g.38848  ORF Transcript_13041/g.38848 Transcript_13041/m.38848 type:complete len:290 (-) Transcript_13041:7-876(-)